MRRLVLAALAAGLVLLAPVACVAPAPVSVPVPAAAPAPAPTTDPGPPDGATLLACLQSAAPGDSVAPAGLPPGASAGVNIDVPRSDLPKGTNRITVVTFPAAEAANSYSDGSGAFVSGTGGTSDVVGTAVVSRVSAGDDALVDAAKACAQGRS